jgi:hypothetical protein
VSDGSNRIGGKKTSGGIDILAASSTVYAKNGKINRGQSMVESGSIELK